MANSLVYNSSRANLTSPKGGWWLKKKLREEGKELYFQIGAAAQIKQFVFKI